MKLDRNIVEASVRAALAEDIGTGDITTRATIPEDMTASGSFIAKQDGVICGLYVVRAVFAAVDSRTTFTPNICDGDKVKKGDIIAIVSGFAASLLSAERVSLNFLQHLSGIATYTAGCVAKVAGTKAKIVDTRKTTPGLRVFEKYAVKVGGGSNHRFNLADGVLIKDNHIKAAGSIASAVNAARANAPHMLKIEVEVENEEMLREALAVKADIIMLDNMDLQQMADAVRIVDGKALTEASGNMDEKDLSQVAATGVDLISMGALTHTVKAMDISLRF